MEHGSLKIAMQWIVIKWKRGIKVSVIFPDTPCCSLLFPVHLGENYENH
jgi:hypothetical protein